MAAEGQTAVPAATGPKTLSKEAEGCARAARRVLSDASGLSKEARREGERLMERLAKLRATRAEDRDAAAMRGAVSELKSWTEQNGGKASKRKSPFREYVESILLAVVIALVLRAFVVEAFKIPSSSMQPTLKVGDHIFVNKFIYGLRVPFTFTKLFEWKSPARGDVIVFINPKSEDLDYIKRVVGIPGDSIELRDNVLYVNGEPVEMQDLGAFAYFDGHRSGVPQRARRSREQLDGTWHEILTRRRLSSFPPTPVREGHVFVLGDNRDNSSDSRVIGQVPMTHIKGQAMLVWWSAGEPDGIRWSRIGTAIR